MEVPIIRTPLHPTYLYYPYIPTLHTYITPTNLQNSACLPWPYIPTLPLQPLHPTLHVNPIPAHLLYEQAVRWCGCVLPVMGYYVLRHLLAKYCIWIWLICWETPEEGLWGVLNSHENLQFWQIAQPLWLTSGAVWVRREFVVFDRYVSRLVFGFWFVTSIPPHS